MKIRADIAEMVRAGHSDTHIAHCLGCHRSTANRVRQALRAAPVRPDERLYAEELPTGRVREYGPVPRAPRPPVSPERAAANRALLAATISRKTRPAPARPDAHHTARKREAS